MLTPRFWKRYFEEYDLLNELTPYRELLDAICVRANINTGNNILDVGSGTGNLSIKLEKYGAIVTGIDFSKEGLEIHRKKSNITELIYGDINQPLPFSNDQFETVVSNNVLYTVSRNERLTVMKELYRVLKPGGRIIVSNVVEGFRPHVIYFDHVNSLIKKIGIFKAFIVVLKLSRSTIKILYYNYKINMENRHGVYDFFGLGEQKKLLEESKFKNVSEDYILYSGQAVLNWGIK